MNCYSHTSGLLSPMPTQKSGTGMRPRSIKRGPSTCPNQKLKSKCCSRHRLATRLNCLVRYQPTAISQPALGNIYELLITTVAGCAGEASSAHLTAAVQGRTLLAMRYWETLRGAETSAPAQRTSSVAIVETFIVKTGAALAG